MTAAQCRIAFSRVRASHISPSASILLAAKVLEQIAPVRGGTGSEALTPETMPEAANQPMLDQSINDSVIQLCQKEHRFAAIAQLGERPTEEIRLHIARYRKVTRSIRVCGIVLSFGILFDA